MRMEWFFLFFENEMVFNLNKLDSPSPNDALYLTKDALCQVLLKLAQWFWRRRF